MSKIFVIAAFLLILPVTPLSASDNEVRVSAWARATPPGGTSGAIYGDFNNPGSETRTVTGIQFDPAHHVMVHETRHSEGMARMQEGELQIPPGGTVSLSPGGLHIMLMGLREGLKTGCEYSFSLTWEDGSTTQHEFLTGGFGQMQPPENSLREECL